MNADSCRLFWILALGLIALKSSGISEFKDIVGKKVGYIGHFGKVMVDDLAKQGAWSPIAWRHPFDPCRQARCWLRVIGDLFLSHRHIRYIAIWAMSRTHNEPKILALTCHKLCCVFRTMLVASAKPLHYSHYKNMSSWHPPESRTWLPLVRNDVSVIRHSVIDTEREGCFVVLADMVSK